jgi:hypothetical protein
MVWVEPLITNNFFNGNLKDDDNYSILTHNFPSSNCFMASQPNLHINKQNFQIIYDAWIIYVSLTFLKYLKFLDYTYSHW